MRLAVARPPKAHIESDVAQYLYCIIRSREPRTFETLGMGERGDVVHTINFEDLAVVTSDSPHERYDNTRRNMMAHMRVLDEVMSDFTVLPIRFDSVAPRPEAVREQLLKARYRELSTLLDGMEDRIEMGLKAFWYEDVIFREIVQDNPTIRRLRDGLDGRSLEETYYDRIRTRRTGRVGAWRAPQPGCRKPACPAAAPRRKSAGQPHDRRSHGDECGAPDHPGPRTGVRCSRSGARCRNGASLVDQMRWSGGALQFRKRHHALAHRQTRPVTRAATATDSNVGILGTIVTAPVLGPLRGVMWLVQTLAEHAEKELYNEDNIRKDLLKLEQQYDLGKITIEEFESAEGELLQRLNQTRRMKEGR